jgi:hypothetical protein
MPFKQLETYLRNNFIPFTAIAFKGSDFRYYNTAEVEQLEMIEVIFNNLKRDKFSDQESFMNSIEFFSKETFEDVMPVNFSDEYDILHKIHVDASAHCALLDEWNFILVIPIDSSLENYRTECMISIKDSDHFKSMIASIIKSLCTVHPSKSYQFISELIINYTEE